MAQTSLLDARVEAVNKVHAFANQLYEKLVPVFRPLVGKQIVKSGGSLLVRVAKMVPELEIAGGHVYQDTRVSFYGLNYRIRASAQSCGSPSMAMYHECVVEIGKIDGCVLTEISDPPTFFAGYKADEIRKKREALKLAEQVVSEISESLYPFGEYDR